MKVALVYDRINKFGGAERLLLALNRIFPEAPLYTSVNNKKAAAWANKFPKIYTSFLNNFPYASKKHELYAPFMPLAFESFNFDEYDLVISVTSEAAKGIITKPHTFHLCICLTPTRYLWSGYEDYFTNPFFRFLSYPFVWYLRVWDKIASRRPDKMISISQAVKERVKKYYDKNSQVVYPPLSIKQTNFVSRKEEKSENYFLIVARLVPYKRIDIAIKAANELRIPLKIIGKGVERNRLKNLAGKTVEFISDVEDKELISYYRNAQALIFPGIEDFGLAMVEAQFFGIPVIAYKKGGALEIVQEGKTGKFFEKQTPESLVSVLKTFDSSSYNKTDCIANAKRFSFENFKKGITRQIQTL